MSCYQTLKYAFSQFLNWDMMLFQKLPVGKFVLEENLYLLATINVDDLTENGSTQLCGNNGIYFLQVQSTCVACFLKEIYPGHVEKWQPDGALKLIDRKNNIFKLSEGEYVAVEKALKISAVLVHLLSRYVTISPKHHPAA